MQDCGISFAKTDLSIPVRGLDMNIDNIREYCLSLPFVTEEIQWGHDLLFKIGDKMFAVIPLDNTSPNKLSFKCDPEKFAELIETEGIIPAPYVARYHWVAIQKLDALPIKELKQLIKNSYDLVYAKLPQKVKTKLSTDGQAKKQRATKQK